MPATETAPEDVKRAILALDEVFVQSALAKNLDKLVAAFYAPDAQLFATHAPIANGHAAIKGVLGGLVNAVQKLSLKTAKVEMSGDLAYGTGTYEMTLGGPDGKLINDNGKYVVVYKRQADGQWRAVADIFNSSVPAA